MEFQYPENTHRLLKRQLKQSLADTKLSDEERMNKFLEMVNEFYHFVDEERTLYRRSDEISSRELMEANAQLQAKNDFLDSFNHGMAHDIKNHTSNLQGLITMLQKYNQRNDPSMRDKIIERLELSVNQMVSIVQGFLYLSRAEGKIDSQYRIVDSEELKNAIYLETQFLMNDRFVDLTYDFELNGLFYSRHIIKIILVNLISNSIKFTDKHESARIKVSIKNLGESVEIKVKDNGVGIDLNDKNHKLYSLFNRAESAAKIQGTGVGLFVIKKIVDRNNGSIHIDSVPGAGTTFTIVLPLNHQENK